jgi:hypothetical protein
MGRTVKDEDTETPEEDYTPLNELYSFGRLEPSESDPRQTLSIYGFNSEGHYKFFMKVYDRIIDSIGLVHSVGDNVDILFINEFGRTNQSVFGLNIWLEDGDPREDFKSFSHRYTDYIFRGCIELMVEGLPDGGQYVAMDLSDMVLKYIYENVFENRILQKKFNLNESDERMDRFVDKVLQFLKDDTYEIGEDLINVPFIPFPVSISFHRKSKFNILEVITFIDRYPSSFYDYCIDTYGLDPQYISTLWDQYRIFLMDNFNRLKKTY